MFTRVIGCLQNLVGKKWDPLMMFTRSSMSVFSDSDLVSALVFPKRVQGPEMWNYLLQVTYLVTEPRLGFS